MEEKEQQIFNFTVASEGGLSGELLSEWAKGFQQISVKLDLYPSLSAAVSAAEKASYDGLILSFNQDSEALRQEFLRHYQALPHWCWLMIGPEIDEESWFYIQNGAQDYLSLKQLNQHKFEKGLALGMQRQALYLSNQLLKDDLKWRAQRYEALHETNPHGVVLSESSTGLILESNKAFSEITGWAKPELQAKTTLELGLWARSEERAEYLTAISEKGVVRNKLALLQKQSGERHHVLISGQIFTHRGQQLLLTIVEDHEMSFQTARELKAREALYRSLVDQAPSLMFRLDPTGQLSFIGSSSLEYLNRSPQDLIGHNLESLIVSKDRPLVQNYLERVQKSRQRVESPPLEIAAEYSGGEERFFRFYFWSIESDDKLIVQGLAQDVTEDLHRTSELQSAYNESQMLLERLQHLESAINNHATVAFTDADGTIKYVNDHFCEVSGYPREELIGKNHRIVNSGIHDEAFWESFWQRIKKGEIFRGEVTNRRKDGSLFWVQATVVPRLNRWGEVVEFIVIRTDVTGRKETELALAKSQNLLQGVLDSVEDQIWAVDESFKLIQANRGFKEFIQGELAISLEDGMDMQPVFSALGKMGLHWKDRLKLAMAGQTEIYLDSFPSTKGKRYFSTSTAAFYDENQNIVGAVVRTADVSHQKAQERRLRQSEQSYRTITENIQDLIWTTDLDLNINYVSPNVEEMLGVKASDFIIQPISAHFTSLGASSEVEDIFEAARLQIAKAEQLRSKTWQGNFPYSRKDGEKLILFIQLKFLYNSAGQPMGFLGTSRDVSLREKARQELRMALAKNENLLQALPDLVFILDAEERFIDYRSSEETPMFLKPKDFLGKKLADCMPERISTPIRAAFAKMSTPGQAQKFEYSLELAGQTHFYECRILLGADRNYYCIIRDITEMHMLNEARTQAQTRWQLAAQTNGFGVWDYRPQSNELFWDDNMHAIFGLSPEEFGQKVESWQACVHPEDRAWASEALASAARSNRKYEIVFRILRKNETRYIAATAQSLLDEKGQVKRIIGLNWDVTEREESAHLIEANLQEREAILNAVTEGFVALDAEGRLQYWNPAAERLLHLPSEGKRDQHFVDLLQIEAEEARLLHSQIEQCLQYAVSSALLIHELSQKRHLKIQITPLSQSGLALSIEDRQIQLEQTQEIAELKQHREALVNTTKDLIWLINPALDLLSANRSFDLYTEKLRGQKLVRGESIRQIAAKIDGFEHWKNWFKRAFQGEEVLENYNIHWEGQERILRISLYPVRDNAGSINSVACYAQDLTDKIRFTKQLERQNKHFRDIAWLQSHGVRAPLARFMSLVEVLSEEELSPSERRKYLSYAQQAARELDGIIAEISEKAQAAQAVDEAGA